MEEERIAASSDLLEMWARLAELGAEIPVTLLVKGVVVSGALISSKTYLRELANQFRDGAGEFNRRLVDILDKASAEDPEQQQEDSRTPRFLNLKDARIWTGDRMNGIRLWRGQVTSVDGFSLGVIESH